MTSCSSARSSAPDEGLEEPSDAFKNAMGKHLELFGKALQAHKSLGFPGDLSEVQQCEQLRRSGEAMLRALYPGVADDVLDPVSPKTPRSVLKSRSLQELEDYESSDSDDSAVENIAKHEEPSGQTNEESTASKSRKCAIFQDAPAIRQPLHGFHLEPRKWEDISRLHRIWQTDEGGKDVRDVARSQHGASNGNIPTRDTSHKHVTWNPVTYRTTADVRSSHKHATWDSVTSGLDNVLHGHAPWHHSSSSMTRIQSAKGEILEQLKGLNVNLPGADADHDTSRTERFVYWLEKYMNSQGGALFKLLGIVLAVLVLLLGTLWFLQQYWREYPKLSDMSDFDPPDYGRMLRAGTGGNEIVEYRYTWGYCIFIAFQVILTASIDTTIDGPIWVPAYMLMVLVGLLVLGILIGMLTEGFTSLVQSIRRGELKAVERDHTLVLGWSEGTVRLVCQLAFLRRQYQRTFEKSWVLYFLPWLRVPPSTSVATGTIVIMCNSFDSKEQMDTLLNQGFSERGISREHTRIGSDVICRVGDPTNVEDLQRVGAQHAKGIVLQLADADARRSRDGGSTADVQSGITVRCLMALRFVLHMFKNVGPPENDWMDLQMNLQAMMDQNQWTKEWDNLRIVVDQKNELIDAANFYSPVDNSPLVHAQNLKKFLTTTVFSCISQRGLAQVLLELMSFDGAAIRFRKASDFPKGGKGLVGFMVQDADEVWENAVLLGVRQVKETAIEETRKAAESQGLQYHNSGMLPDRTHVIKEDDEIVFLAKESMPKAVKKGGVSMTTHENRKHLVRRKNEASGAAKEEMLVLICGWKKEWDRTDTFLSILNHVATDVSVDTQLHFFNDMPHQDFAKEMKAVRKLCAPSGTKAPHIALDVAEHELRAVKAKGAPTKYWTVEAQTNRGNGRCKIKVVHVSGKPDDFDMLKRVLKKPTSLADEAPSARLRFQKAIVIPPAGKDPQDADTFILSMILMMRQTHKVLNRDPIHIVAENSLDATSKLAMVPRGEATDDGENCYLVVPDFVNTQAIKARAMTQVLAFPQMADILQDIFDHGDGKITLLMVDVSVFALNDDDEKFSFKEVKERVWLLQPTQNDHRLGDRSDDVCLGFLHMAEGLQLPPDKLDEKFKFKLRDKLVILTRKAQTSDEYEMLVNERLEELRKEWSGSQSREPDMVVPEVCSWPQSSSWCATKM